ncbi:MAG: glycerol kinase GlpK [Planctomycetes bacterium]|jgi:glycerol kinase|nr:glycerol kinase GlpK [Planctomycetota bacterium]HPY74048.1 glycerol kinase GlpK [Planctomycetota bacterium]
MQKFIMAIDQGTTGNTVLLINQQGEIISRAYHEFPQIYPQLGWVEHDPMEIWNTTIHVIKDCLRKANLTPENIHSIGITNQRETTVIWDKATGKPVYNAIVWQCRRGSSLCQELRDKNYQDTIQQKTGLIIDSYFSATKIAWILKNVPHCLDKAKNEELCFGTMDTWLLYKLTGGKSWATDYTNASRTMLFDINKKQWDDELLDLFNIPSSLMPEVKPSSGIFGITEIPELDVMVPISGMAGDQQAALYGQGCWESGTGKNTYGTGCFLLINTGDKKTISSHGLLTTLACDAWGKPIYALEGSIFIAGAAVQWLRDSLQIIQNAEETEEIAQSISDTKGVYFVPAFTGLGTPYWDSQARGTITGLTHGTGRKEIVRATLESIAFQTKDVVNAIQEESGVNLTQLNVDGGATANNFLMQFQSDILNVDIHRPKITETTAMGVAYLAGLGSGYWSDPKDLQNIRTIEKTFTPKINEQQRTALYHGWKQAIFQTKATL